MVLLKVQQNTNLSSQLERVILVYSLKPPVCQVFVFFVCFVLGVGIILTQIYALNDIGQSLHPQLPLFIEQCGQIKTIHIQQTSVPAVKIHLEPLPPIARK